MITYQGTRQLKKKSFNSYISALLCAAKCVEKISAVSGKDVRCEQQRRHFTSNSEQFACESQYQQQLQQFTSHEARLKNTKYIYFNTITIAAKR